MKSYSYTFDNKKPRKKITCPKCGKQRVFVRYIDTSTNEYLPEQYGKCDRDSNCGYWQNPYIDGYSKRTEQQNRANYKKVNRVSIPTTQSLSYIPSEILRSSLKSYETNNLISYLIRIFGIEVTTRLVEKYYIGTSKRWEGATVFWRIDITGRITAGKVMLYDPETGKRIKEPFNHVDSVHNLLNLPEPKPTQCLFGEHLLKGDKKPVAVVESEKTAMIASVYLPQYIWVATGSLNMLTTDRCLVLRGYNVTLFPDLNCFERWNKKAQEISSSVKFVVSNLLELKASENERKQGLDIADYLLAFNIAER